MPGFSMVVPFSNDAFQSGAALQAAELTWTPLSERGRGITHTRAGTQNRGWQGACAHREATCDRLRLLKAPFPIDLMFFEMKSRVVGQVEPQSREPWIVSVPFVSLYHVQLPHSKT